MSYTTVANVAAYLQTTIDGSSTPTSTTVGTWIDWVTSEIETITKTKFETQTFTDLIISVNSDNSLSSATSFDAKDLYADAKWDLIKLPYKNILTITSVYFNTAAYDATPVWEAKTIGYGGDVILEGDCIKLLKWSGFPLKQNASIKVSGTYGDTSMPYFVEKLATYMVALEVMNSQINTEVSQGGGSLRVGDIQIGESSNYTTSFIKQTQEYVESKLKQLGTHNVYVI